MLKTAININDNFKHHSIDSCSSQCSLYPKANTEIQHGPKYKANDVLAKRKYN